MANSFIKSEIVGRKKQFVVIETNSELVLARKKDYNETKKIAGFINKGGAFAGHTPPFIVRHLQNKS